MQGCLCKAAYLQGDGPNTRGQNMLRHILRCLALIRLSDLTGMQRQQSRALLCTKQAEQSRYT